MLKLILETSAQMFPEMKYLDSFQEAQRLAVNPANSEGLDFAKTRAMIAGQSLRTKVPEQTAKLYNNQVVTAEYLDDRPPFISTNDMPLIIDGVTFPIATFVGEIMKPRNVVQTASQGNDGNANVVETSSLMNAQFTIKGVATAYETGEKGFPMQWLDIFENLVTKNKTGLDLENKILNRIGINYVVFRDYKIMPRTGTLDFFGFSFSCIADNSPELELWNQEEQNQDITTNEETNTKPDFRDENYA